MAAFGRSRPASPPMEDDMVRRFIYGAAALVALAAKRFIPGWHPLLAGALILSLYGAGYFGLAALLRVPQTASVLRRLRR